MLEALKTALKLPDLRKKLIWTVFLIAVFRIGALIPIPGPWDPHALSNLFKGGSIFDFLDLMGGGALKRMAIFAMGVNPYITSSIIVQLLGMVIPSLERLSKEGTEGRKIINQYVRYGTVVLSIIQGGALIVGFGNSGALINPTAWDYVLMITTLTAGSVFLMWLGEIMSERGIGNGISMIIFASIVARVGPSIVQVISSFSAKGAGLNLINILVFIVIGIVVVVGVVFVTQGERKIPVQYAKRMVGRKMYGGGATYLPMKVNQAGVIPVIFASSIMAFPMTIAQFMKPTDVLYKFLSLFNFGRFWYLFFYAILIFVFTYFYTAVSFNPTDVADNMKKYGGFIPGIRPGKPTAEYLDRVLTRITLAGALFLTIIALVPYLINAMPGSAGLSGIAFNFGGTSILIAVGVAIDVMKQIEAQLLMRQYEGFLK